MELNEINLRIGRYYRVIHSRKGGFHGQLIAVTDTSPGDKQDKQFLRFRIDTSAGSGQERLANAKLAGTDLPAPISEKDIRPSLIKDIKPYNALPKQVKVAEAKKESVGNKLKRALGL